jgi:hypothetical protein
VPPLRFEVVLPVLCLLCVPVVSAMGHSPVICLVLSSVGDGTTNKRSLRVM